MRLEDKVAVVTGGARGIGRALARRFGVEGARGVVVVDQDEAAANDVAEEISGVAIGADVAVEADIVRVTRETERRFGRIDLFCSNAGIAVGAGLGDGAGGPFASDADWRRSWEVNVMAHVYAARAVLPGMLARGEGWLLQTASAAGLLTDLLAQAYSVTKHAAVGFAEWLAIAYGERGIRVSCLCPQGVRTPMLSAASPAGAPSPHLAADALEPEDVAEAVIQGLAREEFLILPHPAVREYYRRRADDTDRWLRGMQRLRARLYGA